MPSHVNTKHNVRLAVICGDGLPVSGLLTTFRNVIDTVTTTNGCPQLIHLPIPVDLGYSWRPDKDAFFPGGPKQACYPSWFSVTDATPIQHEGYAEQLLRIRNAVAQPECLSSDERRALHQSIEVLATPYQQHFEEWFEAEDVDWVFAINMTLSDSVSVTLALHRAAEKRWGCGRNGGVLFWDHDLLKSYAVHENDKRVYPSKPNEFTPVPQDVPWHVWAVVSDVLASETRHYPTRARPLVVPNLLPVLPYDTFDLKKHDIILGHLEEAGVTDRLWDGRPILLCPVRVFPVKGIEISIRLFTAIQKTCRERCLPVPYLLIFGDPEEDSKYAAELKALADELNAVEDVRFMGGVPICSGVYRGVPLLDEKALLCVAAATHGGVLFTPCIDDVESVGLGPALASIAGLPCAVTKFNALQQVYSKGLHCVHVDLEDKQGFDHAARKFVDILAASRPEACVDGALRKQWIERAQNNRALMSKLFPTRPWTDLLLNLARRADVDKGIIAEARSALTTLDRA